MTKTSQSRSGILSELKSPTYRAMIIDEEGRAIAAIRVVAESDDQAIARTRAMVDGHAVELWDGQRFLQRFPPASAH